MKKELSKMEKFREYMKEMWYRYQCYYRCEMDSSRKDCHGTGEKLSYYLKYSEEERNALQEISLDEERYVIDHWDEYLRLLEEEKRFKEEDMKESLQKIKKIIFFWK